METSKISCCIPRTLPDLRAKLMVLQKDQFDYGELLSSNKNTFCRAIHNPDIKMKKGNQTQSLSLNLGENYKSHAMLANTILTFKDFVKNCFNIKNFKFESSSEYPMKILNFLIPKDLRKLEITFSLPTFSPFPCMKRFSLAIIQSGALKSLKISFSGIKKLPELKFYILTKSISKLISLETLAFKLSAYSVSESYLNGLSEAFLKFDSLRSFSFRIATDVPLDERGLVLLAQKIKSLSKLENLDLSVSGHKSLNVTYNILADSFNELKNIKFLNFRFNNIIQSNNENDLINLARAIEKLHILESLTFNFEIHRKAFSRNTDALKRFLEAVGNLIKLKSFIFMITGLVNDFVEEDYYVKQIARLKNVENLTYFVPESTSDETVEMFFKSLSGLTALKQLIIRKGRYLINHFTLNSLCETLNCLKNLQEIVLNFDSNDTLKIQDSSRLFETISKLQSLRTLHMDMIFSYNISFCLSCLQKIPSLIDFKILIYGHKMNEKVVEDLALSLGLLKHLRVFYLSVSNIEVKSKTIMLLIEQLKSFENLVDLKFYFYGYEKIDQSVFEAFNKFLDQAISLKNVSYILNAFIFKNDELKNLKQIIEKKIKRKANKCIY